jgi:uncharacterized YigZ family protein
MRAYRTVSKEAHVELTIQKSRFIGWCYPVQDERQALDILEGVRKRHWDATHNCYAYSIGADSACARYSDDGEPGGTAGLPMMEAIRHKGVTNVLCVVTRYFGGILLGAGGLVRAYSKAAADSIEAAGIIDMRPCRRFLIEMDYSRWGALEPLLRREGSDLSVEFAETVQAQLVVPEDKREAFIKLIVERTDGRVRPQELAVCYGAFAGGGCAE